MLDSLFALAKADDGATPRCVVAPAALPGRLETAAAELFADRRSLRLTVALPTGRSLEVEVNEQIACAAEAITAPEAIEAVAASGTTAALEALLTAGHTEGWLLATPSIKRRATDSALICRPLSHYKAPSHFRGFAHGYPDPPTLHCALRTER